MEIFRKINNPSVQADLIMPVKPCLVNESFYRFLLFLIILFYEGEIRLNQGDSAPNLFPIYRQSKIKNGKNVRFYTGLLDLKRSGSIAFESICRLFMVCSFDFIMLKSRVFEINK